MYVKMIGKHGDESYYRKLGDCFDFVWDKEFGTDLTEEQAKVIMEGKDAYCKWYGASNLVVEH